MSMKNLLRLFGRSNFKSTSPKNVVFITGCDSGLGFNLALLCHSLNMTVVSGCHNANSDGAKLLQKIDGEGKNRMITLEIDLLKQDSISRANEFIQSLIDRNAGYEFTALVNNAGIMCFGEFEWQTRDLFESQINVNVLGTMRLTKEFLPLIRSHSGRIINVTSHCGLQSLPALAPYAASKAALRFWNDSLRIELKKYDVHVVNFIPGSFVMSSNISARQQDHAKDMLTNFTLEQRDFYGDYFREFNEYLRIVSGFKTPARMDDSELFEKFKSALLDDRPKATYIHEPWRYKFYRILFRICPTPISDWLTVKFVSMPTYKPRIKDKDN